MRVAVLGDVHANLSALAAAHAVVESKGYDQLVLLGDLLTYGVDVRETVEFVAELIQRGRTILLRGNHDSLYFDLLEGNTGYLDYLPDWIAESVVWTMDRLPADIWVELAFSNELKIFNYLFCHANPYEMGNWEYINTDHEHIRAAEVLAELNFSGGVFGHTHRAKWFRYYGNKLGAFDLRKCGVLERDIVHILNAGSIGQPRDTSNRYPSVLWLNFCDETGLECYPSFLRQNFNYRVDDHFTKLSSSGISRKTLARLMAFFNSDNY